MESIKCPLICTHTHIYIHIHKHTMEYYPTIQKSEILFFDNMDGPRGYYAVRDKSEEDKHHTILLTHGI